MKSLSILKNLVLLTALIFTACKKEETTTPEPAPAPAPVPTTPATTSFFSAKVDGQAFPAASAENTIARFMSSTKMLQITGQPSDRKETIVLTLMPFGGKVATAADWKPGTYDFDPVHISNLEYSASAEYNKWNGNGYDQWFTSWDHVKTGKIVIESNSGTHIKGSFSFDAVKKNSNGSFDASSVKKISEGSFDLDIK